MPAYKDETRNNWYCAFYFEDWNGERKKKMKRGFETKKAAQDWERQFLLQRAADTDMRFDKFVEQYIADRKDRLRENTWLTKEHIINTKILPYFKDRKLSEIQARDVIAWQNELMSAKDDKGKPYSSTYLKTVHNQLSAIFNHAVKYYNLRSNPAQTAGNMGSEKRREMLFWTREEYAKFATAMMDKPRSFYAFEVLYWCGIREGELLALTPADFDLEKGTLSITKSYQRLNRRDVITDPKTPKSVRVVKMPSFLTDEIRDYLNSLYGVKPDDRIFDMSKSYLHHEMDRGAKAAGVKRIRMESAETELWEEEPDPLLEEVAKVVSEDNPKWEGSVTAFAKQIQYCASPISLAMRLNVCADQLKADYHIRYERYRSHKGRGVRLTLERPNGEQNPISA